MKKCSSLVWKFFDRLEDDSKRCIAVLCKLCDIQYKYFGNTTNLRVHLSHKHPLQWELAQNGTLEDTKFRIGEESTRQAPVTKRRKYTKNYKDQNVDVLDHSETECEGNENDEAAVNIMRQMHESRASDEEWLEDDSYSHIETFDPARKRVKYNISRKIKREVQSPPPQRLSNYVVHSPGKYDKPERVVYENRKDEYSVFGEYVANKLRKFKAPRTRGNIQQLITTILWQAEYGVYDEADTVKKIIMYSVQSNEPTSNVSVPTQDVPDEVDATVMENPIATSKSYL